VNVFQFGGLVFSIIMITLSIAAIVRQRLRRTPGILWLILWIASATAILRPNLTQTVAKVIGIGRGADLVMYCGLLATAIGLFLLYLRLRHLEANITKIVRHMAIQDAKKTEKSSDIGKKQESFPDKFRDNQ
jgi:hypothetical protein